jgi:hypothetical protein
MDGIDLECEAARSVRGVAKSRRGLDGSLTHDKTLIVMNAPVQIRKTETVARLRRLASREGKSITDLVDEMARERDERADARDQIEVERRRAAVKAILARVDALPRLEPWPTDDDFYDEDGLPK